MKPTIETTMDAVGRLVVPKAIREALPPELADKPRLYAKDLPRELREAVFTMFMDGLEPLREAGQLGSILLQYPKWFFPISESRDQILEAREMLGHTVAIELRNASWFNDKNVERTLRFLADNKLRTVPWNYSLYPQNKERFRIETNFDQEGGDPSASCSVTVSK